MPLPRALRPYLADAESLLAGGAVGEVVFSGGTYQVHVIPPGDDEGLWAFLQFDQQGQLKDTFCSCDEGSEGACSHVAAAHLRLSQADGTLLHRRCEDSLWWVLSTACAQEYGYDVDALTALDSDGGYSTGKGVFRVVSRSQSGADFLRQVVREREPETEETSIKFSQLDEEELERWREGRPSAELLFELSWWADLAKELFLFQDAGKECSVQFEATGKDLPTAMRVTTEHLEVTFPIHASAINAIVPALGGVETDLSVHHTSGDSTLEATYDPEAGALSVTTSNTGADAPVEGKVVGDWRYVAGDGFYYVGGGIEIDLPEVVGPDILPDALSRYGDLIRPHLKDYTIHRRPVSFSYTPSFDSRWNLEVRSYLRNPGDLDEGTRDFGEWIFVAGDGFYHVTDRLFPELVTNVKPRAVAEFVTQNRSWLNAVPGFQLHMGNVESQMAYHVCKDGSLAFEHRVSDVDAGFRDFGRWVYVAGNGFYPKSEAPISLPVEAGMSIAPDHIPVFIKMNHPELELVPGFFAESCPVAGATVSINLDHRHSVTIEPVIEMEDGYSLEDVRFFDDWVYCPKQGFSEVPLDARLPERFRYPTRIGQEALATFFDYELDLIKNTVSYIDPRLDIPENLDLSVVEYEVVGDTRVAGLHRLVMEFRSDTGNVPVSDLIAGVHRKKRFIFSDAGRIDLHDPRFRWLKRVSADDVEKETGAVTLSTLQLIRLDAVEPLHTDDETIENALRDLLALEGPKRLDLTGLKSTLRSYQEAGVRWLCFLYRHGLSGLLCDDMGLGKTHEAMALMAIIRNGFRGENRERPKFLVVCPTSVIYSWQEKLAKFMPDLNVHTFHGAGRKLGGFLDGGDVLLTSYGIWRNEQDSLKALHFELAVFDEVQVSKNRSSRTHRSLQSVQATMRLGMTGTPIENKLWELKALFDVVLPGYMPGDAEFRERYVQPIEKVGDERARDLLIRFIKPFVLRRRKIDVLDDLPPKTEEVSHCMLSSEQHQLYQEAIARARGQLMDDLNNDGAAVPYLHVFALLTQLKQICDHPAVYLKDVENYQKYDSGKWDLFRELLLEARHSGQKVVVFTQYLSMLDIMELYLKEEGIEYASIRGSTRDRPEQLKRFNTDPECGVFLGSLQAIGLGVDLTAASVVIHYDRWWNAARENQATDRVHRIGQTRGVQVFKLVTKQTFEERIDELIMQKGKLMEEVVTVDDQNLIKTLSREELMSLLSL